MRYYIQFTIVIFFACYTVVGQNYVNKWETWPSIFKVESPNNYDGNIRLTNTNRNWLVGMLGSPGSQDFHIYDVTQASSRLKINPNGYLGINLTTDPLSLLHLSNTSQGSFYGGNRGGLTFSPHQYIPGNIQSIDFLYAQGSNPTVKIGAYHDDSGSRLYFGTSNHYAQGITNIGLALDYNGNISVGNVLAKSKLHVYGGQIVETEGSHASTRSLSIINKGSELINYSAYPGPWRSSLQLQSNEGNSVLHITPSANVYPYSLLRSTNAGFRFHSGGANDNMGNLALTIEANGKVGIGVENPISVLDVNGTIRFGVHKNWWIRDNAGGTQFALGNTTSEDDGNIKLSVIDNGHVGIGTRYPSTDLHIVRSGSLTTRLSNSTNGVDVEIGVSGGLGFVGTKSLNVFGIMTGDTERMRITNTGFVGIGTTSPTELLTVNGNIRARKLLITQTNWPDYVFAKGYYLMPLNDVKKFINTNKHLPGMPSEEQITNAGLDVGNTQALLLKKIEELTLYVIQLKEENQAIKKEIQRIKNKQ